MVSSFSFHSQEASPPGSLRLNQQPASQVSPSHLHHTNVIPLSVYIKLFLIFPVPLAIKCGSHRSSLWQFIESALPSPTLHSCPLTCSSSGHHLQWPPEEALRRADAEDKRLELFKREASAVLKMFFSWRRISCISGGGHEQDPGSGYRGGPQHEEDCRPDGSTPVCWPDQGSAAQEASQHAATRGQDSPWFLTCLICFYHEKKHFVQISCETFTLCAFVLNCLLLTFIIYTKGRKDQHLAFFYFNTWM